jgi:HlyD family secretion protein
MMKVELLEGAVAIEAGSDLAVAPAAKEKAPKPSREPLPKRPKRRRWLAPLVAVLLAAAGTAGVYAYVHKPAAAATGSAIEVKKGDLTETASATGKIQPEVQVDVKSKASGAVAEVLVKPGDHVEAGQLLVRLDKTDANRQLDSARLSRDRAQADVVSAQSAINVAQIDLKNDQESEALAQKGVDLGVGSADALRTAQHTTQVAKAGLTQKQAQLSSAQLSLQAAELAVQDAETQLTNTEIKAPMDGTVLTVSVEKGSIVSSALTNVNGGTAVLTLADLSDLRVIGSISESQVGDVQPGQEVRIRVDTYADKVFKGVVDRVSPLGTETSNVVTFDVEIRIDDPNQSLLKSGMNADVEIVTDEQKDVLLVPITAVQSKGKRRFVTLASGEERAIETGASDGTVMVVTKGLSDGDSIKSSPVAAPSAAPKANNQKQRGGSPMGGMPRGMGGR